MKKKLKDLNEDERNRYCREYRNGCYGGCIGCPFVIGMRGCLRYYLDMFEKIKDKEVEVPKK